MLKNILNLNGAQQLSKNAQKSINGGGTSRAPGCGNGYTSSGACDAACVPGGGGGAGDGQCVTFGGSGCWYCIQNHK